MVWDETGLPLQGLTGGFGADRRVDFPLPKSMRNGVTLYIECVVSFLPCMTALLP